MASEGGCILIQKQTLKQNMKYLVFCASVELPLMPWHPPLISGLILAPVAGKPL